LFSVGKTAIEKVALGAKLILTPTKRCVTLSVKQKIPNVAIYAF
jgi:hypothetical protein